jgi:bifunctional non-homologous end joining protein LigD
MEQITLYYRHGSSDKVYQASIQSADGGFIVPYAFGRRGTTLQTGTKTHAPVAHEEAKKIFDHLIAEKQAKGYTPGADGTPYQDTPREAQATGILPQLLNPVDEDFARKLIVNPLWWMQEKLDGRRLLLQKRGPTVTGINRRGLQVALPETLVADALASGADFLVDGEAVGDQLFVFDLLRMDGADLRPKPYLERHLRLLHLLATWERRHIQLVPTACVDTEKAVRFEELKANGREGVVFKQIDQPYTVGRPASGGPALKFKFEESASFVVSKINGKRSVSLLLFEGEKVRPAGNVTIPANHQIPEIGKVVEVRYLYAFRESGCIYQPVFLGVRDDLSSEECTVEQLKWKSDPPAQAA